MRTKQNIIGILVLAVTFMTWLSGVGDTVKELTDWHGASSPAIVGVLLSQFGKLFGAAIGGMLIDIRSTNSKDRADDRISDSALTDISKKENG